jgi:hypothetical protein
MSRELTEPQAFLILNALPKDGFLFVATDSAPILYEH